MARQSKKGRSHSQHDATPSTLPSRDDILNFINGAQGKVGKREIARAFGIKGPDRVALKALLSEMASEGLLAGNRKGLRQRGRLPSVTVLEIAGQDDEGDLFAEPTTWDTQEDGPRPRILISDEGTSVSIPGRALGVGDRILARIKPIAGHGDNDGEQNNIADDETDETLETNNDTAADAGYSFICQPIRRLSREKRRMLGIFRSSRHGGGTIEPVDRKSLRSWAIKPGDESGAEDGDLVYFDLVKRGRYHVPQARISDCLGNPDDERQISLIAMHAHGLPDGFPNRVLAETEDLPPPEAKGRTDLTNTPLITIDPPDARDHDDAVHAASDTDPKNPGGFVVTIAIADVAHYVTPGSYLDKEAQRRGNSVYFPDRVVPMLPEKISNDLCSLREGEVRPCLAVQIIFNANGEKRRHTFLRALMRSAAKLSYQEAQAAFDGQPSEKCTPLLEPVLKPLWQAYTAVRAARERRGPLELDLPERKIVLDEKGHVKDVVVPDRLEAHKLIEEFMIQANVAAAEALEAKSLRLIYRAHDKPSKEKLKSLSDFLETLDLKLPASNKLKPSAFNSILKKADDMPVRDLVNEVVLRSQAQAEYTPDNYGHFGLNLARYAHFTSPIRRYADLVVHRLLISHLKLGAGGYNDDDVPNLGDIAQAISEAERRAMMAERETVDRLIAMHLADRVGGEFKARVSGVTRSGIFIRLEDTGADGFVPISTLGDDYYDHIEEAYALVGQRSGRAYRLGDVVQVRLEEAVPTAGALRFEMLSAGTKGALPAPKRAHKGVRPRYKQRPRSNKAKHARRKKARQNRT